MNILIVDDEQDLLERLRRGLHSQNYQTIAAINASEALRAIKTKPQIDLVLMDYVLPEMNGLMLLERIRKNNNTLPVIMMTAFGDKHIVVSALQHHCNGYIEKPFTILQLLCEIHKVTSYELQQCTNFNDTISYIAHQINNPLMAIIGSAELGLEDETTLKKQTHLRDHFDNIIGAANQIKKINQQIMGLGRIMTDKLAPVDLLELLKHCLKMYVDYLKKNKITVSIETDGEEYLVMASHFALEQVFENLLLNAVAAAQESTCKQIKIALSYNKQTHEIEISVEDNGIGIEPDELPKVFSPYYTSKPEGNGLGLAVVKSVVEQFNGHVQVKSWLGEGTHFLVALPSLS